MSESTQTRRHTAAKRCEWRGERFDSKAELARWLVLREMARTGEISDLQRQTHFRFNVTGPDGKARPVGRGWKIDFTYMEDGRRIAEDTKGRIFRDIPLRRDLFQALYPDIELRFNGKAVKRRREG
jgi:hypothetical protein